MEIMLAVLVVMMAIEIAVVIEIYILVKRQHTLLDLIEDNTFKSYIKDRIDLMKDRNLDLNEFCDEYMDFLIMDDTFKRNNKK